jgi:uncharacterized membrane protein YdjX (TVP38/TMEM64 family)
VRSRLVALLLLIAALAITAALLPLRRIPDAVAGLGAWAPVVGALVAALLLVALVPRTAISIACGALFGAIGGGLVGLVAAMCAAVVTFALGRALGRDAIAARAGSRWSRLDAWLSRRGLLAVTVVRMMPIAPYGLVGYAYGTTSVRRWHYLLGTFIGGSPSAFTYAAVGAAAVRPGAIRLITFLPAAIGLVITIAAAIYWRYSGRRS